jgi:hypothetical protein
MKALYCWRCRMALAMLERHEWPIIQEAMRNATRILQRHRSATDPRTPRPIDSAAGPVTELTDPPTDPVFQAALDAYERITGVRETHFAILAHHIVEQYGPPCHKCGRPLRTPKAQLCGSCMAPRRQS